MVRPEALSDPVCPRCRIGKAHFDRAPGPRPGHPPEIDRPPFQRDPELRHKGGPRAVAIEARVEASAGRDPGAVARLPATDAGAIRARAAQACRRGTTAVATVVLGSRPAMEGAQPPEARSPGLDARAPEPGA